MRGNQLPVSVAWWQHEYQIFFATFILWKFTLLLKLINHQSLWKYNHRFGILRFLDIF
jgi:hypothetical protein